MESLSVELDDVVLHDRHLVFGHSSTGDRLGTLTVVIDRAVLRRTQQASKTPIQSNSSQFWSDASFSLLTDRFSRRSAEIT